MTRIKKKGKMPRYILFDINEKNTKAWEKKLRKDLPIKVQTVNVKDIHADIFISPANGYGQLDGGIDKIYRSMFPNIQREVNSALLPYKDKIPNLGVGSGLIVQVLDRKIKLLLAPTMDLPSKLNNPWNAYWAALAIFYLTKDFDGIIAIPGLGTGTGHISPKDMAEMINLAWNTSERFTPQEAFPEATFMPSDRLILPKSLHEEPIPVRFL